MKVKNRTKAVVFVSEGKGGIGKTTASKAVAVALQRAYPASNVVIIDTDHANPMRIPESSGIKVVRCDITHVRRSLEIVNQMDQADIIVVDGRGGDADLYVTLMKSKVLPEAEAKGFKVVWLRPITTSHFTRLGLEKQVAEFTSLGVRYVIGVMLHSGRKVEHYDSWFNDEARVAVLEAGAHEIRFEDLGVDLIDNMAELGVSFVELLNLDFSGLESPFKEAAQATFEACDKLAVTAWIRDIQTELVKVLETEIPANQVSEAD